MTDRNFGRGDLMVLAAVRYCLGRKSYIVSDCVDWLIEQWPNISDSMKKIIQRDVEEEFKKDNMVRAAGEHCLSYKPLGMDCDRAEWERVRNLWR